jgi:hypothetical protein
MSQRASRSVRDLQKPTSEIPPQPKRRLDGRERVTYATNGHFRNCLKFFRTHCHLQSKKTPVITRRFGALRASQEK